MNGASLSRTVRALPWRRIGIELLLLAALGLLMAVLGPYRTVDAPPNVRVAYWLMAIMGGGLIGVAIDLAIERVAGPFSARLWPRVLAVSLAMTPPVTLLVLGLNHWLFGAAWMNPALAWQVFVIALLVMAVRALAWRKVVETRTLVMPPLPEAERAFRMRLSARRRSARLIALEAEDHYVRVHTDAGSELVSMRFSEALEELAQAHGFRLHRSWWAAADAIEAVRWNRGSGEARLAGGLVAPVSRSHAPALKEAGWR